VNQTGKNSLRKMPRSAEEKKETIISPGVLRGEFFTAAGKSIRNAINQADELHDKDSADFFSGISRGLDKSLWFVEAHVQAEK
jgi:DNA-binding ferritin-like protein